MLILADNVKTAYAFTANKYSVANASADGDYVIRTGDYVFICSTNSGTVEIQKSPNFGVQYGTLTGLSTGCAAIVAYDDKVYTEDATTTGTLREWALVGTTWVSTGATVAIGAGGQSCQIGTDLAEQVTSDGRLFCARGGTSDTYVVVNLNTMTISFTSTNLNTQDGCNEPSITVPNLQTGYTFVYIRCSDRINTYTQGTNTLLHSLALANPNRVCVTQDNSAPSKILVTRSSSTYPIYLSYTVAGGFTTITATVTLNNFPTYCSYDSQGKRFLVHVDGIMTGLDIVDADVLFTQGGFVGATALSDGRPTFWYYDDTYTSGVVYAGGTTQDAWYQYDMSGLPFGTGGSAVTPPVTGSGGVDCTLPENANILICRLGGTGSLGSAGNFVIGNFTEGTGLVTIGCSIGIVDCTTDDNPRTNGLGLLIFIMSIFLVVGFFYYAIGRDVFQMPIFIWIVIIVALSAFFTITGLIDPIFLILSIVAIVALAVPKILKTVQGDTFGGSGSTE